MGIHNYMEDIVENVIDDVLFKRDDLCKCEKCKLDVMAWSLNRLPSKYIATQKGRVYAKLEELNCQFNTDVTREIAQGIDQVKGNPRH